MSDSDKRHLGIPPLHDAVLLGLEILWSEGVARMSFRSAEGMVILSVKEFNLVECPRHFPWGKSESVNKTDLDPDPSGTGYRFAVEMQSGDGLLICGATVEVEQQKHH
jgi:hypothetical protein